MNMFSNVHKVIGVVSGKGGVGKSSVTAMLAAEARKLGKNVAVLDADITGSSIPKIFGLTDRPGATADHMLTPIRSKSGIKIMSTNLLLEDERQPVLWRGPILGGVIEQFWRDVVWGETDVMFVDMPPGTGDVPLTVYQQLPISGIIVVTSPQSLVEMIVEKAVNMADMMTIPILGIVENMSYFTCPDCGKTHSIFGESTVDDLAADLHIANVTKLPIDPALSEACDKGTVEDYDSPEIKNLVEIITKDE
jgi:Mrp family chromosome partitioning ATPase